VTAGKNRLHVAQAATTGMGKAVDANAALIAAGPDLLEALTEAVKHAQPLPSPLGSPLTEHADVWPDWVIAARAAITRATGA
jgi:hypothetical protein